ncbi:MAG TPA: hypothetical protein PLL45_03935 [Thermoflexales bacterium]|nr:hypothetical protein [Thermoflexales bacterium]
MTHSDLCQNPPALSEDDLFAAIDGSAGATINTHLAICGYCARRKESLAREMQTLEGGLRGQMFRQGCPDAETLADYALGALAGPAKAAIDQHLSTCLRCSKEAAWVREALAPAVAQPKRALRAEPEIEPFDVRLIRQVKRIFATLLPVQPQFALRGESDTRVFTAEFEGGQAFVELTPGAAGWRLTGQLLFDDGGDAWRGAFVQIRSGERLTAAAVTDDLLEFGCDLVESGPISIVATAEDGRQFVAREAALA